MRVRLKTVSINKREQIFLDGQEIENVIAYKLENSASPSEPAKLTIEMFVTLDQVASES